MGSSYAEAPLPGFEHLVRCRWTSSSDPADPFAPVEHVPDTRVVPDGCADVHVDHQGGMRAIGTMTSAIEVPHEPGSELWALRLRPEAVRAVLGVPASELVDRVVPLDHLLPSVEAEALARYTLDPTTPAPRALTAAEVDPAVAAAVDLLWQTAAVDVASVADEAWLSTRHLRRRLQEDVGIGPKLLQRIGRLHRFLDLLDRSIRSGGPGPGLAAIALAAGYADQAHANRDVLALTGATPGRLATERRPPPPQAPAPAPAPAPSRP
ncbi:helix-turn-helix transcriptional regulator [soil metagenome]